MYIIGCHGNEILKSIFSEKPREMEAGTPSGSLPLIRLNLEGFDDVIGKDGTELGVDGR